MNAAANPTSTPDLIESLEALVADTLAVITADPVMGSVFDGTASRDVYLRFLTQTYHYVLETTPLLRAGARALAGSPDAFKQAMHERFVEHAEEEKGHDQWLLDDIAALGADVEAAKRAKPTPAVDAYVALVRLMGVSRHPLGLLGFAYFLERVSAELGISTATNMKTKSSIPNIAKALSFVESHGTADQGHTEEGRQTLRKVKDPRDQAAILLAARLTAFSYTELLGPAS